MSNTETLNILMNDVFISWTGKDRQLKNRIAEYLRENNLTVLESDRDCVADFRLWSCTAVSKCTVFLLLYTENTVASKYVPIEIEEIKKLDNWRNRCLPVVSDYSLYAKERPDLAESQSAIVLNGHELSDTVLKEILHKVQMLINNRFRKIYSDATKPNYLKLQSFLRMVHVQDREFNYDSLYIQRTVKDENGSFIHDASKFTTADDIFFLQGPAGSGKSCYIDQLRETANENVLVIALPCRKLTNTSNLFQAMFEEFCRHCGNRDFYSEEDFKSLLSVNHLLLVLDGMDEIATKSGTRQLLDAVSSYYNAHAPSTTLFFTSRNIEDADIIAMNGQTPKRLKLCLLEEEQIKAFGNNLFRLLGNPNKSDTFYVHIKDLADEVRTNPLLLSQLAIIYDVKNEIPKTAVGIYDAVCEITLSQEDNVANIPFKYRDMVTSELSGILKAFSAERYRLLSIGKRPAAVKILSAVMKNTYNDAKERAVFLEEYLQNRAMFIDGEFYHKMLLEYFTAVYYYEHCFDNYDELERPDILKDLFSHYDDPYWSMVLQLFLVKADSAIDAETTVELYRCLMANGIIEYTLLFDTCRDLVNHKETAQRVLLYDILKKSVDGIYPPYGPLFWYVPEYELYTPLLLTLDSMTAETRFTKALALTRDVCWIFGHYHTASEITDRVNGKALFSYSELHGVRYGLCQLFYTGSTNATGSDDIYPRCFNLAEAKHWKKHGCGIWGHMTSPFNDDLGLYSHTMFSELGGEYIGIVAVPYEHEYIEAMLTQKSCQKLCGLFLSSLEDSFLAGAKKLAINDTHLKMVYTPEHTRLPLAVHYCCKLNKRMLYFRSVVKIPAGMTSIGGDSFSGCTTLTKVDIPDTVTGIGSCAFMDCTALTKITIPDGVSKIHWKTFFNCTSLTDITIPHSVTVIGDDAFYGCTSLTKIKIPNSVTEIGMRAFCDCTALTKITIPNSVTEIGMWAFENCTALTVITIPDSVTIIDSGTFMNCTSLAKITLPISLTAIGGRVFENCAALINVTIPNRVSSIGGAAFSGCTSLTQVKIPNNVRIIEASTFSGCTSLTNIQMPNGVSEIRENAFLGCASLPNLQIPNSVRVIGENAFLGCASLTNLQIPNSVRVIGENAFSGCISLTEVKIPNYIEEIGKDAFKNCTALKRIDNCPAGYTQQDLGVGEDCVICTRRPSGNGILVIAQGMTRIAYGAYRGQHDIRKVVIPVGVTEIGEYAFSGCTSLTEITIPDSVTRIEQSAFKNCAALAKITIPAGVRAIKTETFLGCTTLTEITIPDSMTEIEWGAFCGCTALTKIALPSNMTIIWGMAFKNCSALTEVAIPNRMTRIEMDVFSGCTSLTKITLPDGVKMIDRCAFSDCISLTGITIPDSVTRIDSSAFSGCASLTEITIPNRLTRIEPSVFSGCTSLTKITLPDRLTEIDVSAFQNCIALTEIILPNSLTKIGGHAFENCTALTAINIPNSVTTIGYRAFQNCASLESITIPAGVRVIDDDAFGGCHGLKAITVSRRYEDDLSRIFSSIDLSQITIHWI